MDGAMGFIPDIRFGTERYPEKVARRLRTVNFGTWTAAAAHGLYAVLTFLDFVQLWWVFIVHIVLVLLFASAPLLHRVNSLAAPVAVLCLFYADMLVLGSIFGTGTGVGFVLLPGAALAVLYFGFEHKRLMITFAVIAAALDVAMMLTIPEDNGLLPRSLMITTLVVAILISAGVLLTIVAFALDEAAHAEAAAEREYERSERLLVNILPSAIAARLKSEGGAVIADRHDEASILFADMAGFTAQASDTEPDDLVKFLNRVFSDFDRLVERHGLEKIKTTGDAYMVVSGVPVARPDHAQALAALALEMRDAAREWRDAHGRSVPIRMGLSCGPVVAGVVGTRKIFYDVWGDAVNVAARMETTGAAGKIQVSQEIHQRLRDDFELESRGEIDVKGKGRMPTWFLLARKPPAVVRPGQAAG
jgi:adenylate cyclase